MEALFLKLVNMSISASIIVLAILLARIFMRKAPKWVNVAVWVLVALRLCLPFSLQSELSLVPNTEKSIVSIASENEVKEVTGETVVTPSVENLSPETEVPSAPVIPNNPDFENETQQGESAPAPTVPESVKPAVSEKADYTQIILNILIAVWLVGITIMLTYMIVSYVKIYFRIREGAPDTDNTVLCDRINTAFIMGIVKPTIYLPSNLDERYKKYVIAHESAHLKRKDYLWKLIAFILLTVYWFNPLVWVAYIMLCRDIEFACDEKVIKTLGESCKADYSEALLNCSIKKRAVNINPLAFGEVSVKDRIINILNYKKPSLWITIISLILVVCIAVCFMTDPVDKTDKKDNKEKVETVVSKDDDANDTSSEPTSSEENKGTESKPTESEPAESEPDESEPQDTSSEEEDYDFLNDFEEDDYIITEEDNVGNLSREKVKAIKELYLKSLNSDGGTPIKIDKIKILKYYGTLSDGSIAVDIDFNAAGPDVVEILNKVFIIEDYIYYADLGPMIYKNNKLQNLKTAYENGTISTKIVDEFFSKHSYLDISSTYLNEKDNCAGMEYLDICYAKQSYRYKLHKEGLNISDLVINDYYGKINNNYDVVLLGLKESVSETVTEQIGRYEYTHPENQGIYVYYSSKSNYLNSSYFRSSKIKDLLSAYKRKLITDEELDKIAKHYPQYFIADDE